MLKLAITVTCHIMFWPTTNHIHDGALIRRIPKKIHSKGLSEVLADCNKFLRKCKNTDPCIKRYSLTKNVHGTLSAYKQIYD